MALFAQALAFVFKALSVGVVVRVLAALGIGIVSYTGIEAVLGVVEGKIDAALGGLSGFALAAVVMLKFPECVAIIMGAWAFRLATQISKRLAFVPSQGSGSP